MRRPGQPLDPWSGRWHATTPTGADSIRRWQLERAWTIAEQAAATNPFYRRKLTIPPQRSAAAFASLAVTTKDEVVEDCMGRPPYGARSVCSPSDVRHFVETSGTTGKGQEVYPLNEDDERAIFQAEAIGFWWAGVRPGSRVMLTLPVGTRAAGIWYYHGLRLLGANVMAAGAYRTAQKVELLRRYGTDVLVGTPSYLQRLTRACQDVDVSPAQLGVRALMVSGESYTLRWAHDLQTTWSAPLFEQYGCTERAIAWACPPGAVREGGFGVLHFPPEISYCEVVNPDTGEHVADREIGEIIVTPLQADASPLVRFATRDRVRWIAPGSCSCGRPLAGLTAGGVQRYDDMLKVRGINVWPSAMDGVVLGFEEVVDYRGVVRRDDVAREVVEIRIECRAGTVEDIARRVGAAVRQSCGLDATVNTVAPGEITDSVPEGFVKTRRWQDERAATRVD